MNFIAVEERNEWTEENWMLPGDIEKLRTAFAGGTPCPGYSRSL